MHAERLTNGDVAFVNEPQTQLNTSERFAAEVYATALRQVRRPDGSFSEAEVQLRAVEIIDGLLMAGADFQA